MKKLILCLAFLAAVTAYTTEARAQSCAATVWNAGANTVMDNLYESDCAVYSWTGGLVSRDYTTNCCITSVWIRVNGNDWNALAAAGKLDGLRYQRVTISETSAGKVYSPVFRKMVGTTPVTISSEDFSR